MQFGRYEIIHKLSAGGMGEVYLARMTGPAGFSKPIALKRIFPHLMSDPKFRHMLAREAKLTADLNHPNIVQVFEFEEHEGELFIAMEYVQGVDMARLSEHEGRLPNGVVALVAFDVLDALNYAHNLADIGTGKTGLIHRDISPQNILVSGAGFAKLCDFGIARAIESETFSGTIRGKVAYMSPEQLTHGRVDERSDIFSLGVVLYESLGGRRMIEGDTIEQILESPGFTRMSPLRSVVADVPAELASIIDRAVLTEPDERFPSAREFQKAIESFLLTVAPSDARMRLRELVKSAAQAKSSTLKSAETDVLRLPEPEPSAMWTRLVELEKDFLTPPETSPRPMDMEQETTVRTDLSEQAMAQRNAQVQQADPQGELQASVAAVTQAIELPSDLGPTPAEPVLAEPEPTPITVHEAPTTPESALGERAVLLNPRGPQHVKDGVGDSTLRVPEPAFLPPRNQKETTDTSNERVVAAHNDHTAGIEGIMAVLIGVLLGVCLWIFAF